MNTYIEYLEYLEEDLAEVEHPPLGHATPELLKIANDKLQSHLGASLPQEVAEFLALANGYNWNGVFFFTIDEELDLPDLIHENEVLRSRLPEMENYLVLGQSSLWFYARHLPSSTYQAISIEDPRRAHSFTNFDDFMSSALEETLELLGDGTGETEVPAPA